jgi:hypothetical protein
MRDFDPIIAHKECVNALRGEKMGRELSWVDSYGKKSLR